MTARLRRIGLALWRGLLWSLLIALTLAVAALATFLPLSALPGEFHTDFVNGHWVKPVFAAVAVVAFTYRLSPRQEGGKSGPPTFRAGARLVWRVTTAMLLVFWPAGLLVWANAYGVKSQRAHDMVVTGTTSTHIRPTVTPIEHILLKEIRSGWRADLEPTEERNRFASPGSCVRIGVRRGRLGLDWISDARPIPCPNAQSGFGKEAA